MKTLSTSLAVFLALLVTAAQGQENSVDCPSFATCVQENSNDCDADCASQAPTCTTLTNPDPDKSLQYQTCDCFDTGRCIAKNCCPVCEKSLLETIECESKLRLQSDDSGDFCQFPTDYDDCGEAVEASAASKQQVGTTFLFLSLGLLVGAAKPLF